MSTEASLASNISERRWSRLSNVMASFHDHFKQEFNTLYELADGSFTNRGLSLARYLRIAQDMNHHLTMHHTIEELHIFPKLAKRMPQFSTENEDAAHIISHKRIHDGLENLESLVNKWKKDSKSYSPAEMRTCLDSFREVLFHHLDEEVEDLRAENLKKYFSLQEVEQIAI